MTPGDVIEGHHIGKEYADLVADLERVPAIYDAIGLFSFPPVVNGRRTEVSTGSRDLFIEMTGTDQWTIDHMLNIVCYALDARGGQVEEVRVEYSADAPGEYSGQQFVRPDLATKTKTVSHERIEQILGIEMDPEEVVDCAERAGLDASGSADEETGDVSYEFDVPPYRVDVLHPLDVIDDIGRAYGFNTLEPEYPRRLHRRWTPRALPAGGCRPRRAGRPRLRGPAQLPRDRRGGELRQDERRAAGT